jgi:hypothetical protein
MAMTKTLLTLKQFAEKHKWTNLRRMQYIYRYRVKKGLESAFLLVNQTALIDEEEFFRCIKENQKFINECE